MDTTELSGLLKRLCKVAWAANVTNPITYVTQISYLLFLKMLEEWDAQAEQDARDLGRAHQSLFEAIEVNGETVDYEALRWSRFSSDPDNERMLRTVRDLLPRLADHPGLSQGAQQIFTGAALVIPDGASLRRMVDLVSPLSFVAQDADVKGDLFEILVDDLGSQKRAAQFRTPRHLIRVITQMVDPGIGDTVCDPAAGTGGFLIAAHEHIRTANSSPEFIREVQRNGGQVIRRGLGDKLTPPQRRFLDSGTLHGFESDQDIIRMSGMNAVLHGFDQSPLIRRDSIAGSEDRWDEVQFDVILTNPPFSGEVDRNSVKRSLRVDTGTKYLLFLALCLRSLRPGGRCGIILPNGALFGDTGAHFELKRKLLDEFDLQAVVSLPVGMFQPYTGIPTAFLVFARTNKPTESVWFYRVEGDGSSLKGQRKFGPQFRDDFPDLLTKWPARVEEPGRAWCVPARVIRDKGMNLTLSGLGLTEPEKVEHQPPEEILERVAEHEARIAQLVREMQALLEEGNGAQ
ncbi:MAG: SAM-dependent DNA methyltransferase [Thermoflexales bacterium]|nr:SAM-dependent DNA methyltransferase [Thermoflexales bacterium]